MNIRLRDMVKGIIIGRGHKIQDFAEKLGIKHASLSRKFKDNALTLNDLLVLSEFVNADLCIVDKSNGDIILNISESDTQIIKKEGK